MIYFRFSPLMQTQFGVTEYAKISDENSGSLYYRYRYFADTIFIFSKGETDYIKDRYHTDYQYSSEEMVVISLSAVLLY